MARRLQYDADGNFVGMEGGGSSATDLDSMTVAELKEKAAQDGVDLGDATKKADIVKALGG